MTEKESKIIEYVKKSINKKITQSIAAKKLSMSTRNFRRKVAAYKKYGTSGIISKKRGKPSNRKLKEEFTDKIISLIKDKYSDFGPTLATEKLLELDGLKISAEKVRQLMIKEGIWHGKSRKKKKVYQLRERRSRSGELIQADGSPHDWFEGRRAKCCLIVMIDDATSELMKLKFFETETTEAYTTTLQDYVHEFGRPRAFYVDKHSIFRVNNGKDTGNKDTQFSRILRDLNIDLITANTPQAKGRVERANKTLQDRLVKELRLRKIDTIDEANKFLDNEYREMHNSKFMVDPKDPKDMHREIIHNKNDEFKIFSIQSIRKVDRNLHLSYKNQIIKIDTKKYPNSIKKEYLLICENFKNEIKIYYKNQEMNYSIHKINKKMFDTETSKTINKRVDKTIKNQENEIINA